MTTPEAGVFPYLHGFSHDEQERLRKQARFAEYTVYQNINLSEVQHLLEIGCGVGAQGDILLRRFPGLKITGIDLSDAQLKAAQCFINASEDRKERYSVLKMDASKMNFSSNSFDGAFVCWILEHVPEPKRVLSEIRRVLRPGSPLYLTEVMNSSFFLDPYSPQVWKYWMAFNDYQHDKAGDPFVGAKLGNLLMQLGFKNIETQVKTWHLDNRHPQKRMEIIQYWTELLLSASEQLLQEGYVTPEIVDGMKKEMEIVSNDPNAVFFYSFIQAKAYT